MRTAGLLQDRLEIAITVTAADLQALADSVDYFLDLGVPTILLAPRLTHDPGWRRSGERALDRQLARVCRSSRNHLRRTGRVPVAHFRNDGGAPAEPGRPGRMCGVGSGRTLVVDVDGSVYGCVLFAHSYQRLRSPALQRWIAPLRIGRIDDPALDRRLDAFRARVRRMPLFGRRDRKHSAGGRCAECPALAHCAVCPVAIAHVPDSADPYRMPDLPCAFTRATWRHVRHFRLGRPTPIGSRAGRRGPRWCATSWRWPLASGSALAEEDQGHEGNMGTSTPRCRACSRRSWASSPRAPRRSLCTMKFGPLPM